jgi:AMP phosphorylase
MPTSFHIKLIDLYSGEYTVILNPVDAQEIGVRSLDRVRVMTDKGAVTALVETSETIVADDQVGILKKMAEDMDLKDGDTVRIQPTEHPQSVDYIKKKMDGHDLNTEEIRQIVDDIGKNMLSDIELSAYVSAIYMRGMTIQEVRDMTLAMVEGGETIEIDKKPVFDHHSIGGVPGNKVTLLVVPIVAAAGLIIPKTSSRAISSASGTADTLETICNVTLSAQQIKNITEDIGGVIAWGGGVNIAPADDIIIRAEYPLAIDPYAQVIASVMAKKKAVGAEYFVLDIPLGPETKVQDDETAKRYARDFIEIGRALDMEVACAITYGGQPIGRAIGPALEVKEALEALEGKPSSSSLIEKSLGLAAMLLEMGGMARPDEGKAAARKILEDGRALKKFQQIVEAQGGKANITSSDVPLGKHTKEVFARESGYVSIIHNKALVKVIRAAGAPKDKGAGMMLHKKLGDQVKKGETIYTIYSDHEGKLDTAWKLAQKLQPYITKGMILDRVTDSDMVMTHGNVKKL